jgi:hypothetical protein
MSDQHAKDPKELEKEKPDYVEDTSGSGKVDHQPQIGTDPMETPQEGKHKKIIAPDPAKIRDADRKRDES